MDRTSDSTKIEKIIIIHTPLGRCYYNVGGMRTDTTACIMCESNIPFESECITIKIDDSFETEEINECVKFHKDDLLDEQERFLKEKEKRNFRRMCKGRR